MERPAESFPLAWPTGHPRTKHRRRSAFVARSIAAAFEELRREMRRKRRRREDMEALVAYPREGSNARRAQS